MLIFFVFLSKGAYKIEAYYSYNTRDGLLEYIGIIQFPYESSYIFPKVCTWIHIHVLSSAEFLPFSHCLCHQIQK